MCPSTTLSLTAQSVRGMTERHEEPDARVPQRGREEQDKPLTQTNPIHSNITTSKK